VFDGRRLAGGIVLGFVQAQMLWPWLGRFGAGDHHRNRGQSQKLAIIYAGSADDDA